MFDITTEPKESAEIKHFNGVIVDRDGMLNAFHYVLDGSYYSDTQTKQEYDEIIDVYKNKFIIINNVSKYDKLTSNVLETDSFQIESPDGLIEHKVSKENNWGSIRECIQLSLKYEVYNRIYNAGRPVPNMETRLIPFLYPENALPLFLIIMTDNGLVIKSGMIKYEFMEDRTESCPSCVQGFITFQETINRVSKHIIAGSNKIIFNGAYIHDLNFNSDETITKSLYESFRPIIELARIKTIKFEEIK